MSIADVVIVGGGPAGLSAAIWLGRYRRDVIVLDAGAPRNEPAWAVHGYPGVPDPTPTELRRRLFQQAQGAGARLQAGVAMDASGSKGEFSVRLEDGGELHCRRLVLAYGLRDYVPEIPGLAELYGTSVFHCADCDGPAFAGARIGVLGHDRHGANLALYLRHWTPHVTLLAQGRADDLTGEARHALEEAGIGIAGPDVTGLVGHGGNLTQVELGDGGVIRLDAIFFHLGSEPRCDLAEKLRCELDDDGYTVVDRGQETTCPGVYATGDITGPPHLASIAAAEGVRAALTIHRSLLPDARHV
ncbi:MAG TPA: NAD(P)/FAD-dependent oxidoreductase [Longimicrobiales bacterium]|nr:NAD(P)/FAD-dependent oxidoreductase [Longimicrobiales bacterium]